MADLAGLDEAEQGVVATVLLASYLVTPTMAFSVSGLITVIVGLRHLFPLLYRCGWCTERKNAYFCRTSCTPEHL